jgi:cytochrome c-type biogenesis protein
MELLAPLSDALAGTGWIAALAALGWGFASIWLSPCHLAGIPLVVGYLSVTGGVPDPYRRARVILAFALGSLLSLLPLGLVTLLLGRVMGDLGISSNYLVALICLAAGLYLLDWLPLPTGRGLPRTVSRGAWTALALGMVFGLALGPCAFAWIAPLLGVTWMQAAQGLVLPALLLGLFGVGHCAGVLVAAGSLDRVQRWLDGFGGFAWGRSICGGLLLLGAGALVAGA